MAFKNNYSLGRGKLYFAPFIDKVAQTTNGERYLGNSPAFSLKFDSSMLDHYSSDAGIKELDDQIALQVTREGSLTTDHVSVENLALFFFGTSSPLSVTGATVTGENLLLAVPGMFYQLGVSAGNPAGARGLVYPGTGGTLFKVTDDAGTPQVFVDGTDYNIDPVTGRLEIIAGGAILSTTNVKVNYTTQTKTQERVISGSTPVEGTLRYIANNPEGKNFDYIMPWVKLTPDGDFSIKSDEWQAIKFKVSVLKKTTSEAIYVNGRPL